MGVLRKYPRRAMFAAEATLYIVLVLGAIIMVIPYVKRAVQGNIKAQTDGFGQQYYPDNYESRSRAYNVSTETASVTHSCTDVVQGIGQAASTPDCNMAHP